MSRLIRSAAALALCLAPAAAQTVAYPDFSSVSNLALNGAAAQSGTRLRLVPSASGQIGSAWHAASVPVEYGFDTRFTFQTASATGGGADGFCFVVQNDPRGLFAIGADGSALGYGAYATSAPGTAIANSLVVEFDTFLSTVGSVSDLSGNEISVHTAGVNGNDYVESFSIGRVSPSITFSNAVAHTARIQYVPGTLRVYLDNLTTPVLTVPYSFATGGTYVLAPNAAVGGLSLQAGGAAYVGFTAATGGSTETYDVLSWTYDQGLLLDLAYDPTTFSINLSVLGGDPFGLCINAITLSVGAYPNGWFYGLDIPVFELLNEYYVGAPFLTLLDAGGSYFFSVGGVPPAFAGLLYGVSVEYGPTGVFKRASPPTVL
jgi:hypothetical protein